MKVFFLSLGITMATLLLSYSVFGQQAIAPGSMSPVGQYLLDSGASYMLVRNNGKIFLTIFTKDSNMKAADICKELTKIGPVTKVTIRYEAEEETQTRVVVDRSGDATIIHDGSVESAVCTK